MAATLALPTRLAGKNAQALETAERPVLVWLEFQDCAGNSESMLRTAHPTVAEFVLDLFSWEYHELIMAGAGDQAEEVLQRVVKDHAGKFIAVVEGAIPTADGGVYCTINGRTALDIVREVCPAAAATIAVGACAWDGGLVRAAPNPTGAVGVQEAVSGIRVVNIGGCPHNPVNTAAVLTHYLTFGHMPALDRYNRPLFAYGQLIHDQCERRTHYDNGQYVEEWGDEGDRKGWCLYKMGCKGPQTHFNCPSVRWNEQTSWPVKAGHGCIGCASHRFWDTKSPFYQRLPAVPGFAWNTTAGDIGAALVAITAAATGAHAVASVARSTLRREEPEGEETDQATPPERGGE
jgi:hydrogenase small subunit